MRFRQIIHEFAKFGIIGIIGLAITNVGYAVLHSHSVGPITSTTITLSWLSAVVWSRSSASRSTSMSCSST